MLQFDSQIWQCVLILLSVGSLSSFEANDVVQQEPVGDARTSPKVLVEGSKIPQGFTIDFADTQFPIDEAAPLEFVLVMPQQIDVDGVTLPVHDPFYISTTELSNGQYAQLREFGRTYEEITFDRYLPARLDITLSGVDLEFIETYLANPNMPAVHLSLDDIAAVTRNLGLVAEAYVRVPTIGEWFAAMRAGSPSNYWWGDELEKNHLPTLADRPRSPACETVFELHEVREGVRNPLGLLNVLGNAGEYVIPSDEERRILREQFGPLATAETRSPRERSPRFQIGGVGGLALGGSVISSGGVATLDPHELISTWEGLLVWSQVDDVQWCGHIHSATGVRLVIEIPPGEWQIIDSPTKEHP